MQTIATYAFHGNFTMNRDAKTRGVRTITGVLDVSVGYTRTPVRISISTDSNCYMCAPPIVYAPCEVLMPKEPKGWADCAEWHRYESGRLCWVREDQWRALFAGDINHETISTAAAALTKHVTDLLRYHIIAARQNLKKWPKEWPAWPHGDDYKKEKKHGRSQN